MNFYIEKTTLRKEKTAKETIEYIKKILSDLNIETDETLKINNGDSIFSCRVTMKGTDFGSNGKGINEEYALASAYAEFMERLQTRYLFLSKNSKSGLLNKKERGHRILTPDEVAAFQKEYFFPAFDYQSNDDLEKMICFDSTEHFYQVRTGNMVSMHTNLIDIMCGSNGLCAGNTMYEAIVQGIGEIFERMSYRHIVLQDCECAVIPEEIYKNTYSMKMINYLKSKKYNVIVKDFTLGGRVPVLGIILVSPTKTKAKLSVASDINFDIALQRCITEVLQGRKLDGFFPVEMKNLFSLEKLDEKGKLQSKWIPGELLKMYVNGSGELPLDFIINSDEFHVENLNIFNNKISDNKDAYKYMLTIIEKNHLELYIKDYSIFGFPTYRVFIKNESHIHISCEKTMRKCYFRHILNGKELKEEEVDQIIELLHQLNDFLEAPKEYNDVALDLLKKSNLTELTTDSRYLEILLLLYRRRYADAYIRYNSCLTQAERKINIDAYLYELQYDRTESLIKFWEQVEDQNALKEVNELEEHIKMITCRIRENCEEIVQKDLFVNDLIDKIEKELCKWDGKQESYRELRLLGVN